MHPLEVFGLALMGPTRADIDDSRSGEELKPNSASLKKKVQV
jgi:hypothetical protein